MSLKRTFPPITQAIRDLRRGISRPRKTDRDCPRARGRRIATEGNSTRPLVFLVLLPPGECAPRIFTLARSPPRCTCKERVELMRRENERRDITSLRNGLIKALQRPLRTSWRESGTIEMFAGVWTKKLRHELFGTYGRA